MAGPASPTALHVNTPTMATTAATAFSNVMFCVTSKQMKMLVMAKLAMASGMPSAPPMSTPATLDSVQEVHEHMLTMVARGTFQVPVAKLDMFTPKLSSVTVAENKNDRRLGSLAHIGAKDAEYSI